MNHDFKGKNLRKTRVLVAPLDWGLGHATRCIPLIRELLAQDCEVWLAGEGAQEKLLRSEFPGLAFLPLAGYRVKYARSAFGLVKSIFFQVPHIIRCIRREHQWLKKMVCDHELDIVISDNRYGLYHPKATNVFITHQLLIKNPLGKWAGKILQRINYRYINRFNLCLVPDMEGNNNLAGELSHPVKMPSIPAKYSGVLSRFDKKNIETTKDKLLIILSGPEPQRTMLEDKIVNEIAHYNGVATIVRGLPGTLTVIPSSNMIRFYNHLTAEELNKEIAEAEYVISRSGYSTVMDIAKMQKKSILIPTPGQSEQEYLGDYLSKKKFAFCITQNKFKLNDTLSQAKQFSYDLSATNDSLLLPGIISTLLNSPPINPKSKIQNPK